MQRFLILGVLLFVLACSEKTGTSSSTLNTSSLVQHKIEFIDASLWLMPNFQKISYQDLVELLEVEKNQAYEFLLKSAKEYKDKNDKPVFFRDELASENIIVLYPMPYQPIDKSAASIWISSMISSMKQADQNLSRTSEVMEKRIKKFGSYQMAKFKAKQTDVMGNRRYFTQYYISGDLKSFMVIQVDIFDKDIESNLKALAMTSS